ncbi:unnamed protein product [Alopecurus aequalis]
MAFCARRGLATSLSHHLTRRLHPTLSHLVPSHQGRCEDPSAPPHLAQQPAPPFPFRDDLRRRSRSQTLALPLPFAPHRIRGRCRRRVRPLRRGGRRRDGRRHGRPLRRGGRRRDGRRRGRPLGLRAPAKRALCLRRSRLVPPGRRPAARPGSRPLLHRPQLSMEVGKKFGELFTKCGVNPSMLNTLKGVTRGSISLSLLLAILNMVDKVPSLKGGGAYWFTDLTTRDELHILPALTALTIWVLLEVVMRHGHGVIGNRPLQTMKVYRVLVVLMIPFITFPKAVLIHLITGGLFSLGHFLAQLPPVRSYCSNLLHLVPWRVPAQVRPPSYNNLSGGTKTMTAVDSRVAAVKGSEQSSFEPSDLEKKRRISSVINNRAHGESTSSGGR